MLMSLIIALAYFYFHFRYFKLAAATLQLSHISAVFIAITFLMNYTLFFICSVLELNLIINWTLFFVFLFIETAIFCKGQWRTSLFFSLCGIIYGVSANIFFRCATSIIVNQPLIAFDNHISSVSNIKHIPISIGFLVCGVAFHIMISQKSLMKFQTLVKHKNHMDFQLELMIGMIFYLYLNLLLYHSRENDLFFKLWGIKSCLFSLIGVFVGFRYSLKMCRLTDYREQNRIIRSELAMSEQKEARLRTIAYRDALTGSYNRQYALKQIDLLMKKHIRYTLCFLDLNNLKGVNDHHGHSQGDRYLITVSQELSRICREDIDLISRYGGDEFLLIFPDFKVEAVEAMLCQVNQRLESMSGTEDFPFSMAISYGLVESGEYDTIDDLLSAADKEMYRRKRS